MIFVLSSFGSRVRGNRFAATFAALLLLAPLVASRNAQAAEPPVAAVAELFTSQGCSSCPPADALLAELAQRPEVLALSFHVDYWDYIGWADPFANAQYTRRQRAYAALFGLSYVYTPQMVIDGTRQVTGSDRSKVDDLLKNAGTRLKTPLGVSMTDTATIRVSVPKAEGAFEPATVWLVVYDRAHETKIRAGENRGRTLVNRNVVREFRQLAVWNGQPLTLETDWPETAGDDATSGCAVLLQSQRTGHIIGAGRLPRS